jgi:hypothetical protein
LSVALVEKGRRVAGPVAAAYRRRVRDIDALVLSTVNAPWRRSIDVDRLTSCLRGEGDVEEWNEHLRTFFEDVPLEAIFRFILAHRLPPKRLRDVYRRVVGTENGGDGIDSWLADLAAAAG